jgi:tetratricopeptide (TPR) repeat protein
MRCHRTVVLISLSLLPAVTTSHRLPAQAAQQQGTALATRLELSSASAAAKAEFWSGLDDWQNVAWSSAEKKFRHAVALDEGFGLARVFAYGAQPLPTQANFESERDRGAADAARQSTAEGLVALAWREYGAGRWPRVIQLLQAALAVLPDEPHLASEYIWALIQIGENKTALDSARVFQKRFPTFAALLAPLSVASMANGDTAGALRAAEEYTRLGSRYPGSFGYYGRVLQSLGRYDEAEAQLKQALALAPAHADYPYEAASALAEILELRGRNADARTIATQALARAQDATDSATFMTIIAGTYFVANDVTQANQFLEAARQRSSVVGGRIGFESVERILAEANATFGDRRSVSAHLARLQSPVGDSTGYFLWHAVLFGYAGQTDSTMSYSTRLAALATTPQTQWRAPIAHFANGLALQATKQCARALEEFAKSDSTDSEVQAARAECELQQGHRTVALALRDKVLASRDYSFFRPAMIRARMRMMQMK